MTHVLDFQLLPHPRLARAFLQIDADVAAEIAPLRRLSERAGNAVRFMYWAGGTSETLRCGESEVQKLRQGCFRAALTEFVSMEEVQSLDYNEHGLIKTPLRLNDTRNPLLHLFRELRNMEIHLRHSGIRGLPKDILWGHIDHPTEATAHTITIWNIEGITSQSFSQLRNAKRYSIDQIDRMVSWLNATQEQWGIQELFLLAVEEYCRLLRPETWGKV